MTEKVVSLEERIEIVENATDEVYVAAGYEKVTPELAAAEAYAAELGLTPAELLAMVRRKP